MTIHLTYTVKDIQPDKILVDSKGMFSSLKDSLTIKGMTIPVHVSGTSKGNYTISRPSGLVSSGRVDTDINATWSIMGQSINIVTKGKIEVSTSELE